MGHTIMMLNMNLFLVVATWVALLATVSVSVSAKDQQGLRGGQHRALEVHNAQPDEAAAAEYDYFEGSEEEEFLSLEEMEEMGLDAEDRDLAYNYGNDRRYWDDYRNPRGGREYTVGDWRGSGYGGYGYGSGYGSGYGTSGYGSGYGGYGRGNGYGYGSGY